MQADRSQLNLGVRPTNPGNRRILEPLRTGMTSITSQREIRERVEALIASHTGVTPQTIDRDSPIWEHFPRNTGSVEHPTVTSFVQSVHTGFSVYLTEDEWENPTPNTLAEVIHAKRDNPAASDADWIHAREDLRKGYITFAVFMFALLAAFILVGRGPRITRVVVALALAFFFVVMLLVAYRRKVLELDASAPWR